MSTTDLDELIEQIKNAPPAWQTAEKVEPFLTRGDSHAADYRRLKQALERRGWSVRERDTAREALIGQTEFYRRLITINRNVPVNQQFATLAHEAAHALRYARLYQREAPEETLAESTAYLVARARGLDTGLFSASYFYNHVHGKVGVAEKWIRLMAPEALRTSAGILQAFN